MTDDAAAALELYDALKARGVHWRATALRVGSVRVDLIPTAPDAPHEEPEIRTAEDAKREEQELVENMLAAARGFIPGIGDG